jgi:hypothetical protein
VPTRTCSLAERARYLARLSPSLLDSIDLEFDTTPALLTLRLPRRRSGQHSGPRVGCRPGGSW